MGQQAMTLLAGVRRIELLGVVVAGVAMILFGLWIAAPPYVPLLPMIGVSVVFGQLYTPSAG